MIPHAPPNDKPGSTREQLQGTLSGLPPSTRETHQQRHHRPHHHEHVPISITGMNADHVRALARLQQIVFPTLAPEELFTAQKYLKHLELFPEGQFIAIAHFEGGDMVVGATSTFRTDFDFNHIQHTYVEAIADGWLTNHNPHGEWLYGVDLSVHPQFRGRKIARRLYEARRMLARKLNLRGELAGALLPGYELTAEHISIAQYALHVKQGKVYDPTLSVQLRNGFDIRGILYDHISDPRSENASALIVRENPHYQEQRKIKPG